MFTSSRAQDICSCTPLVYEWKLDFQRTCIPSNITIGENQGIREAFCSIEPASNFTTNLVPIKVITYKIIELDMELAPLKSESMSNISLIEGDLITFASITAVDSTQFSGGFQVSLVGVNDAFQDVILEWLVRYSNICEKDTYALGDSIGWMIVVSCISSSVLTANKGSVNNLYLFSFRAATFREGQTLAFFRLLYQV
jgi:hypothetical protein